MIIVFIIISFLTPSIVASQGISSEEFIGQYDPEKKYQSGSEYIDPPPVQRMPQHLTDTGKKEIPYLQLLDRESGIQQPAVSNSGGLFHPLHEAGVHLLTLISFTTLISLLQQVNTLVSAIRSRFKSVTSPVKDQSLTTKDKTRKVQTIPLKLAYGETSQYLSKFDTKYPLNEIPEAIAEVLRWDQRWNPQLYPQDYLQCTTYVAIAYQLNGISLKGKIQGDARDWITLTDTFSVYRSGVSSSPPRELDTVVWAENDMNHVGIVTQVRNNLITVANGNSTTEFHEYKYRTNTNGTIEITSISGETARTAWVPSHWLRPKETLSAKD